MRLSPDRAVRLAATVMAAALLAACGSGEQPAQAPARPSPPREQAAEPSFTRAVPPEQRVLLAGVPAERLCGLAPAAELSRLAFPVGPGTPREVSFDPPTRGCLYESPAAARSVLIAAQPEGFADLGFDEVDLGGVVATKTAHANDCTVFIPVKGATLQVVVRSAEAGAEQCDTAEAITQYVLPAVVR